MINMTKSNNIMFKKDNKDIKLETSREIDQRISQKQFSASHSVLQSDLVKLLTISTGRRDKKWINDFTALKDHCIKIDLWESLVLKYNLHKGFTSQYV